VVNNIYRNAVPAQKYLPEQRSAAFRHHYTPAYSEQVALILRHKQKKHDEA